MKNLFYVATVLVIAAAAFLVYHEMSRNVSAAYTYFPEVRLPKTRFLHPQDYDPRTLRIAVSSSGGASMNGEPFSASAFETIVSTSRAESNHSLPVHIGADRNAPFDKVWPLVLACCSNGLWKVGFVVTDEDSRNINVINVLLPQSESNSPYVSPLVLKTSTNIITIGVSPGSLVIEGKRVTQTELSRALTRLIEFHGIIVIVPSPGLSHGEVVAALDSCHRIRLQNICMMRPSGDANQPSSGAVAKPAVPEK